MRTQLGEGKSASCNATLILGRGFGYKMIIMCAGGATVTDKSRAVAVRATLWRSLAIGLLVATMVQDPATGAAAMPAYVAQLRALSGQRAPAGAKLIDDFEGRIAVAPWTASAGPAAGATLALGPGHLSAHGARLAYHLTGAGSYTAADLVLPAGIAGSAVAFWAVTPAGVSLALNVIDETRQILRYALHRPFAPSAPDAWYRQVVELDAPDGHEGGAGDGILHGSLQRISVRVTSLAEQPLQGEVLLDDVTLIPSLEFRLVPDTLAPTDRRATVPMPTSQVLVGRLAVNIHSLRDNPTLDAARAAGFTWVRMDPFWASVERTRGVYTFARYQALLDALAARGMKAIFIFDYGNPLYQGTSKTPPTSPDAVQAFGRFAAVAARAFASYGVRYEVWNEPNLPAFWPPAPDAGRYAALAREVVAQVKASDPLAYVSVGTLSQFDTGFLGSVIAAGGAGGAAALGVHPYLQVPESLSDNLLYMRALVDRLLPGPQPEVWSSEWGYTSSDYGDGHADTARLRQAVLVARELLSCWAAGCPLAVYYDLRDDGADASNREHNFGLLDSYGVDKPAMQAVRTLTAAANGRSLVDILDTQPTSLHALKLAGPADMLFVLWSDAPQGRVNVVIPAGEEIRATDFLGTPLLMSRDPVTGDYRLVVAEATGPVYVHLTSPFTPEAGPGGAEAGGQSAGAPRPSRGFRSDGSGALSCPLLVE